MKRKRKPYQRRVPKVLTDADERLVTAAELLERFPVNRSTLNTMINAGRFPQPIKLMESKLFWRWSTILRWLDEREKHPAKRRPFENLPTVPEKRRA